MSAKASAEHADYQPIAGNTDHVEPEGDEQPAQPETCSNVVYFVNMLFYFCACCPVSLSSR